MSDTGTIQHSNENSLSTSSTYLEPVELQRLDAYWRASNYLSVGQIYLMDNPLLREPLRPEHIKPRLLGHWGTSPGLNMLYTHLNRMIKRIDGRMCWTSRIAVSWARSIPPTIVCHRTVA
jgi:xylulose-5-phosphate/fructose-6-phosphate phosphoketolase